MRITESRLRTIVKESINNVLYENDKTLTQTNVDTRSKINRGETGYSGNRRCLILKNPRKCNELIFKTNYTCEQLVELFPDLFEWS